MRALLDVTLASRSRVQVVRESVDKNDPRAEVAG